MSLRLPIVNLRLTYKTIVGIAVLALIVGGVLAFSAPTPYVGGWEVQNSIRDIRVNGVTYTMLAGGLPENAYLWTDKNLKFDVDSEEDGVADIHVNLGPPTEKILDSYTGEWVDAREDEIFKTYSKAIGDTYYFWDHHVFHFEVTITLIPDFLDSGYIVDQRTYGEAENMIGAEEAQILLKLNFKLDPWVNAILDRISSNESTYNLDEEKIWTGIMSAQILSVEAMFSGWTGDSEPPNGRIEDWQLGKALLSLFTEVGTFDDTTDRIGEELTDRPVDMAPSEAHVAVGMTMFPAWSRELGGTTDTYPAEINYRFRFDVLSTAGYDLIDGSMDEELDNKTHLQGAVKPVSDFLTSVGTALESLNLALQDLLGAAYGPLIMIAIIAVVALVFYLLLKLGILKRGAGG